MNRALASAILVGTLGALTILISPGFVGLVAAQASLTDQQAGYLAAWDINSSAVAIGLTTFLLSRFDWHRLAFVGLALLAAGSLATAACSGFDSLVVARVIAGMGEGIAIGVSFAALGVERNPDKAFAWYLVAALSAGAIILFALPGAQALAGTRPVFATLGIIAGLSLWPARWMAAAPPGASQPGEARFKIHWPMALLALAGVLLYFVAQGAVWSYFERIGHANGIAPQTIGTTLALSSVAGIAGALLAAALPANGGRTWPLLGGAAVSLASFLMLNGHVTSTVLVISGLAFNLGWNFCQPLLSGICASADRGGRIVCAMGSIQTVGSGLGPAFAAALLHDGNFTPVIHMAVAFLVASLLLVVPAARVHADAMAVEAP
ncbi:MAG: MFS transporter [Proteobacteria bacterium]|nr:MFS transporter [Pseudomonadota bacterium]